MGMLTKKMSDWTLLDFLKFTGLTIGAGYLGVKYLAVKEEDKKQRSGVISEDDYDYDYDDTIDVTETTAKKEDSE